MEDILKKVRTALTYHTKYELSGQDVLRGDKDLLGLMVEHVDNEYEYEILHSEVIGIINMELYKMAPEAGAVPTVNQSVESLINQAIVEIVNKIENDFVANEILKLALAKKKMLRSKMFLKMQGGSDFHSAGLIELFHLSSLIQDDVIDHGTLRRHLPTINSKYDNKTAILVSDYLLVHLGNSLRINEAGEANDGRELSKIEKQFAELAKLFVEKLMESESNAHRVNDISSYQTYAIDKTARFFQVAIVGGLVRKDNNCLQTTWDDYSSFAIDFGLLFQKVDDLMDYRNQTDKTGKDARDEENNINNFIKLSLMDNTIEQIIINLNNEADILMRSLCGQDFIEELEGLKRRING